VSLNLPLYQALFLTAHDAHGEPLVHLPSLGLGLAGAAVLDLMLDKRLVLRGAQPAVLHGEPFGDLVTDTLVRTLGTGPAQRPVAAWLRSGSVGMYDQVVHVLVGAGLITVETRRRLGLRRQLVPATDRVTLARMQTDLLHVYHGRRPGEPTWAALAGLIGVLRLERTLDTDDPGHEAAARLRWLAEAYVPESKPVLAAIEDLLGETAIASFR
jgi:hypothetical protein